MYSFNLEKFIAPFFSITKAIRGCEKKIFLEDHPNIIYIVYT